MPPNSLIVKPNS